MSDTWIRLPRHKWPNSWSNIENLVVLLERNLYGQFCQLDDVRDSSKNAFGARMGESTELGISIRASKAIPICIFVDDMQLAERK